MEDNSRKRAPAMSKAKLTKMIATVEEHFRSRLFTSELSLEDQIEHLSLEILLRDTLVTAKHFLDKAEGLKTDLKTKEIYLFAKRHGILHGEPKSLRLHRESKTRLSQGSRKGSATVASDELIYAEEAEASDPVFVGPPDLRPRHVYCAKRFETRKTDHSNSHAAYADILEVGVPIRHCYRLKEARATLVREFSYAGNVIDCVFSQLFRRQSVGTIVDPILIWGKPGLGKSRIARRICECLGLHSELVSVAGMAEDFLFGVPLGFGTAKASIVTEGIRKSFSANPVIVLDEIDKIADNRRFGSVYDRLLESGPINLLERRRAA